MSPSGIVRDSAPRKSYPFSVDTDTPIFNTLVTLAGGQTKDMAIPEFAVMVFVEMTKNGVNPGDVSVALGENGDFFDIAPSDKLEISRCSQVQFRNNTGAVKTFRILHTNDRRFNLANSPRGL